MNELLNLVAIASIGLAIVGGGGAAILRHRREDGAAELAFAALILLACGLAGLWLA